MTDNPEKATQAPFSLQGVIPTSRVIYNNTREELIVVHKDALQLCLQYKVERIAKRDRWMAPLGILVPLALALITTSFTKKFGIGGGAWQAIFALFTLLDFCWLIYELKHRGKPVTAASIVEELARNPVEIVTSPTIELLTSNEGSFESSPHVEPTGVAEQEDSSPGRESNPRNEPRTTLPVSSTGVRGGSFKPKHGKQLSPQLISLAISVFRNTRLTLALHRRDTELASNNVRD